MCWDLLQLLKWWLLINCWFHFLKDLIKKYLERSTSFTSSIFLAYLCWARDSSGGVYELRQICAENLPETVGFSAHGVLEEVTLGPLSCSERARRARGPLPLRVARRPPPASRMAFVTSNSAKNLFQHHPRLQEIGLSTPLKIDVSSNHNPLGGPSSFVVALDWKVTNSELVFTPTPCLEGRPCNRA